MISICITLLMFCTIYTDLSIVNYFNTHMYTLHHIYTIHTVYPIGISDVTPSPAMLDLKRTILSDGQKRAEDQIEAYNTGNVYYILFS